MCAAAAASSSSGVSIKKESTADVEDEIVSMCRDSGSGLLLNAVTEKLPHHPPLTILSTLNRLLAKGQIELFQNSDGEMIYKYKDKQSSSFMQPTKELTREEQLVLHIVSEAGRTAIWNRDIRASSNLSIVQVNKVIKALESKKLIKEVKGASGRKKMYIMFDLEHDMTQCSSPWLNIEGEAEVEFIRIILTQCEQCLQQRADSAAEKYPGDTNASLRHYSSFVSIGEIGTLINGLNVSKVDLAPKDIESLMDLLVYDCKAEKSVKGSSDVETATAYKLVVHIMPASGLVRTPCGVCPVKRDCAPIGQITPITCGYFNQSWLK